VGWVIIKKEVLNDLRKRLTEYESEDPLIKMKKIAEVLDAGHLDKDSGDYQETIHRCSLELISKYAKVAGLYSQSGFIKDSGTEVLDKMNEMRKGSLSKTVQLEDKRKKK
jgi:hypothetical protein